MVSTIIMAIPNIKDDIPLVIDPSSKSVLTKE